MAKQPETLRPIAVPVATVDTIPGHTIVSYAGPAFGVVARSMGFAKGFTGSFKALKSGEVKEFTVTLQAARHHAVERMVENAQALGARSTQLETPETVQNTCSRCFRPQVARSPCPCVVAETD